MGGYYFQSLVRLSAQPKGDLLDGIWPGGEAGHLPRAPPLYHLLVDITSLPCFPFAFPALFEVSSPNLLVAKFESLVSLLLGAGAAPTLQLGAQYFHKEC